MCKEAVCPHVVDPRARVDVEPGVPPARHHPDEVLVDLAPGQEHSQHFVPEERLQVLRDGEPVRHGLRGTATLVLFQLP